jgi:hypothetical protein
VQIGDVVFVHGGVSVNFAKEFGSVAALSAKIKEVIAADDMRVKPTQNSLLRSEGPLWLRDYAQTSESSICPKLSEALSVLGARFMVMGHTSQKQIRSRCNGHAILIDTGISYAISNNPSALEIIQERGQTRAIVVREPRGVRVVYEE